MLEVSGIDFNDHDWSAQPPCDDLTADLHLYPSSPIGFAATLQAIAARAVAKCNDGSDATFRLPLPSLGSAQDSGCAGSPVSKYDARVVLRLSSAFSKRSDGPINVRNSSLSIASERWIIRANPDGFQ